MACGIGICMTCVLPVKDENGKINNLRSCIDGPVMDGANVQWDLVGKTLVL
jgi:dihydroorotate dehydrogenase electron transfer subunit